MQGCTVMDGEVLSIARGKTDYNHLTENDKVVLKYKYYLSKDESINGEPLSWNYKGKPNVEVQQRTTSTNAATLKKELRMPLKHQTSADRSESCGHVGSISSLDSSAEQLLELNSNSTKSNNKSICTSNEKKRVCSQIKMTLGNTSSLYEKRESLQLNKEHDKNFLNNNSPKENENMFAEKCQRRVKKITMKESHTLSLGMKKVDDFQTKKNGFVNFPKPMADKYKVEPSPKDARKLHADRKYLRDVGLLVKQKDVCIGRNIVGGGLIIKYKYFLSRRKDLNGKPLRWKSRTNVHKQQNHEVIPAKTKNGFGEGESVYGRGSGNMMLLRYHYVDNNTPKEKHTGNLSPDIDKNFITVKKEATVYTLDTAMTDAYLQHLVGNASKQHIEDGKFSELEEDQYERALDSTSSSGYHSTCGCSSFEESVSSNEVTNDVLSEEDFQEATGVKSHISDQKSKNYNHSTSTEQRLTNQDDKAAIIQSQSKHRERITFKADCGRLPYKGVFRLDDDIKYLKTFVHLISGLPPNRQKYFAQDDEGVQKKQVAKRRNARTLRQLGFKDGQIIHLDLKDKVHSRKGISFNLKIHATEGNNTLMALFVKTRL